MQMILSAIADLHVNLATVTRGPRGHKHDTGYSAVLAARDATVIFVSDQLGD
jgi:hypothetical protein